MQCFCTFESNSPRFILPPPYYLHFYTYQLKLRPSYVSFDSALIIASSSNLTHPVSSFLLAQSRAVSPFYPSCRVYDICNTVSTAGRGLCVRKDDSLRGRQHTTSIHTPSHRYCGKRCTSKIDSIYIRHRREN